MRGDILCTSKLSGVPDLTLSFNNHRILDDCSLHPCVRYNRFERERVMSFVPPDGKFKLASYTCDGGSDTKGLTAASVSLDFTANIALPIYVKPQITPHQGGARVSQRQPAPAAADDGRSTSWSAPSLCLEAVLQKT